MAPEIFIEDRDHKKCDIWSAGILLYILLIGEQPFKGQNDEEILKSIANEELSFDSPKWEFVSDEAKDICEKVLNYNPNQRLNSILTLIHDWFDNYKRAPNYAVSVDPRSKEMMSNLKSMNTNFSLQAACLSFIQINLVSQEEENQMRKIFEVMDKNFDGVLTR
jgi:calcium-dependent protein kinase